MWAFIIVMVTNGLMLAYWYWVIRSRIAEERRGKVFWKENSDAWYRQSERFKVSLQEALERSERFRLNEAAAVAHALEFKIIADRNANTAREYKRLYEELTEHLRQPLRLN